MDALIDVSMHPLSDDFTPQIDTFIYKVQNHPDLEVAVSDTSTTIRGPYDTVMSVVTKAMKESLNSVPCTFNLRVLGGQTANVENKHR